MTNQVTPLPKNVPTLKQFFEKTIVKQKLQELVGKNASTFATSIMQIANSNAMLRNAEPMSILTQPVWRLR